LFVCLLKIWYKEQEYIRLKNENCSLVDLEWTILYFKRFVRFENLRKTRFYMRFFWVSIDGVFHLFCSKVDGASEEIWRIYPTSVFYNLWAEQHSGAKRTHT
jgi:hypothetical protein